MKIIYPGSFNPWTKGHQSIYDRACQMFGEVTIVVAINPDKKIDPDLIMWTLEPLNAPIEICTGLVAPTADIIIRGVRSGDWEYEQNLAQWNRELGAETVFLCPDPKLSHVSSSAVRMLLEHKKFKCVDNYAGNLDVMNRWNNPEEFKCKGCPILADNTALKCAAYKTVGACKKSLVY